MDAAGSENEIHRDDTDDKAEQGILKIVLGDVLSAVPQEVMEPNIQNLVSFEGVDRDGARHWVFVHVH